jgi:hypothetical protein
VLAGGTTTSDTYTNSVTRLANIDVVTGANFSVNLNTNLVNLLGVLRDHPADGDNALIKIDGGIDVNGKGLYTDPSTVQYGFEPFNISQPGYFANNGAGGDGFYSQTIDTSQLSDGYHYITVDAFRHRDDGGPPVFTDWKQTIYVDLHKPVVSVDSLHPIVYQNDGSTHYDQQNIWIKSDDGLADSVHSFLDLPANISNDQIMQMVNSGSTTVNGVTYQGGQSSQIDVNMFQSYFNNLTLGNHAVTTVTYKIDGNYSIQRLTGVANPNSPIGAAMGDAVGQGTNTPDGYIEGNDVLALYNAILSHGGMFYPEDDYYAQGLNTYADWLALGQELNSLHDSGALNPGGGPLVSQGTIDYYDSLSASVPEPGSMVLLGGFLGLGALIRPRRRRAGRAVLTA